MSTRWPSKVAPLTKPLGTAATVTTLLDGEQLITLTLPVATSGWVAPLRLTR